MALGNGDATVWLAKQKKIDERYLMLATLLRERQ
jgi:hypothetical protein